MTMYRGCICSYELVERCQNPWVFPGSRASAWWCSPAKCVSFHLFRGVQLLHKMDRALIGEMHSTTDFFFFFSFRLLYKESSQRDFMLPVGRELWERLKERCKMKASH